ncbi:pyrimidine-specific ribonucleoside hydrolase RihA [Lysinibacillus alkalisoli]|uniref:Pyrimidine-specific ribonucleoside hydrolase RihA n=1 Tax=Lysinibacillus alkalisoli TaxID=1911548 RepID=A0A917G7C5_9BACI|nr:nucleoside hydrolase [Lysinibacillus alkalisoli]GGG25488.1 pyrimidine-specific ribonucleoside hydrolase RihA [Lysinibacillus alkalisoli]
MKKIPVIIDTDPGIDDAMMLTLAFASECLAVQLVTTSSGNISQDKTNYNARAFLSYIGAQVEVARGLEHPMFKTLTVAEDVHGETGFGQTIFPTPQLPCSERPAVQAMVDVIQKSEVPITIIATGPLTNVAALLFAHPEVKSNIKQISWMGGAAVGGNMSPTTEFNAYVDPHAAAFVFQSGVPITMSPLDVTHKAYITLEEAQAIKALNSPFANKIYEMLTFYLGMMKKTPFHADNYDRTMRFHDLCAVSCLITPELFKGADYFVTVETTGEYTAGTTVVDYEKRSHHMPNAHVLYQVNRVGFVQQFIDAVHIISERLEGSYAKNFSSR